nr:hypothetical protein [uncultured Campylobacter sp.]
MKNVTLANVKDFAFLANKAYASEAEIKKKNNKAIKILAIIMLFITLLQILVLKLSTKKEITMALLLC